jgi:hypothetical protein
LARSFTPQDTILEDGEGENIAVTGAATAAVGTKGGVMPGQPIRSASTTGTMFDGPATGAIDTETDAGLAGFSLEEVQKLLSDHPDLEALWNAVSTDPAQSPICLRCSKGWLSTSRHEITRSVFYSGQSASGVGVGWGRRIM